MITIIIPTLNAGSDLASLILSLKKQTYPSEITVIDSSSTDNTVSIAESLGVKTLSIKRESFDHGGTRNLAVKKSSGDIIVFLTQDAFPLNEYLVENLVRPLDDRNIALSFGRQIARGNSTPLEFFARDFNYPDKALVKGKEHIKSLGIKTFYCSNVCSAVKKSAFNEVNGFPEEAILNEDMVLAAKLILKDYKVAYASEAKVIHSHNYTLGQQFRRYFDIGVSLNRQRWILEYAKAEAEGFKYLKENLRFLLNNKDTHWMPYAIAEAFAKYTGYQLGLKEDKLSKLLKKHLSMHDFFWDNN